MNSFQPLSAWQRWPSLVTLTTAGLVLSATALLVAYRLGLPPGAATPTGQLSTASVAMAPPVGDQPALTATLPAQKTLQAKAQAPISRETAPAGVSQQAAAAAPGLLKPDNAAQWLQPLDEHLRSVLSTPLLRPDAAGASFDTTNALGPELNPALAAPTNTDRPADFHPAGNAHPDARSPGARTGAPSMAGSTIPDEAAVAASQAQMGHPSLAPTIPQDAAPPPMTDPTPVAQVPPPGGAAEPGERSPQMELIAADADRHTRRGYELAGRNAFFAARAEFVTALRLVADGLDTQQQTATHQQAMTAGLTALRECDDFIPRGSRLESDVHLADIIHTHRTPVLKNVDPAHLATLEALHRYFTFAQEQLATAAGGEVAGSMALQGLGKTHAALAMQKTFSLVAPESKAMTYYQAALLVCPQNYMASNELGVLLARCGRDADARMALEHSLSIQPNAAGWHNLAMVYRQLGLDERAQRAQNLEQLALQADAAARGGRGRVGDANVEWVDSQTFAQMYAAGGAADPWPAPAQPTMAQAPQNVNWPVRK